MKFYVILALRATKTPLQGQVLPHDTDEQKARKITEAYFKDNSYKCVALFSMTEDEFMSACKQLGTQVLNNFERIMLCGGV